MKFLGEFGDKSVHCDNINRLLIFRENMPYLTLIRLTSRLRPLETNGKLPFSLPSLSATEKASEVDILQTMFIDSWI